MSHFILFSERERERERNKIEREGDRQTHKEHTDKILKINTKALISNINSSEVFTIPSIQSRQMS